MRLAQGKAENTVQKMSLLNSYPCRVLQSLSILTKRTRKITGFPDRKSSLSPAYRTHVGDILAYLELCSRKGNDEKQGWGTKSSVSALS